MNHFIPLLPILTIYALVMKREMPPKLPKPGTEISLEQALEGLISALPLRTRYHEQQVTLHWPEIVGPVLAQQTEKVWVRKGTLYVKMKTPSWKNEVLYLRGELAGRINEHTRTELVRDVKVL